MTAPPLPFPDTHQEDPMPMTAPTNVQVGASVRALRKAAGLTQDELAARMCQRGAEIRHWNVSSTELGERPLTFAEALAVADVFTVPLDALIDYERVEKERKLAELRAQQAELAAQAAAIEAELAGAEAA